MRQRPGRPGRKPVLRWVAADGFRPAGWWDGDPWRDPIPVAPHIGPMEAERTLAPSARGRVTRPTPCKCGGVVVEHDDGTAACTRRTTDGGCGRTGRWDEGRFAMRVRRLVETEVEVKAIRLRVPNRYHEEADDQFRSYPEGAGYDRVKHELTLVLDLDSRKVRDWPAGASTEVSLKVRDEGTYELLDSDGKVCASLVEEYVPHCVPEGGDYLVLTIGPDGGIAGWRPNPEEVADNFGLLKTSMAGSFSGSSSRNTPGSGSSSSSTEAAATQAASQARSCFRKVAR